MHVPLGCFGGGSYRDLGVVFISISCLSDFFLGFKVVMLKNRSKAVTSKQAIMGDHSSLPCPTENFTKPISFLLGSPKFFRGFLSNGSPETEEAISPTSIFDTKPFSGNPFEYDKTQAKSLRTFPKSLQKSISKFLFFFSNFQFHFFYVFNFKIIFFF